MRSFRKFIVDDDISFLWHEMLKKTGGWEYHLSHSDTKPESEAATLGQVR